MTYYHRVTFRDFWRARTFGQTVGGGLVLAAIIGLGAAVGAVLQSRSDDKAVTSGRADAASQVDDARQSSDSAKKAAANLAQENGELGQRLKSLETALGAAKRSYDAASAESGFLARYISYSGAQSPKNTASLADSICGLWKQRDTRFGSFETQPLQLTAADFEQSRMSPELQTLLVQNFVSLDPIQKIAASKVSANKSDKPSAVPAAPPVDIQKIAEALSKDTAKIALLKAIAFSDGNRFDVPRPVAVAVQIKRECVPAAGLGAGLAKVGTP